MDDGCLGQVSSPPPPTLLPMGLEGSGYRPGPWPHRALCAEGAGDRQNLGKGLAGRSSCLCPLSPGSWPIAQGHSSQAYAPRCSPFPFGWFLFDVHFNQRKLLRGSGGFHTVSLWLHCHFMEGALVWETKYTGVIPAGPRTREGHASQMPETLALFPPVHTHTQT